MKLFIPLILLFFFFIGPSYGAAGFEEGLYASRKGDYVTAFREFRSMAETGHAPSQLHLGILYEMGLGINKNYAEAEKWYQKAAIQGEVEAQNRLIEMRKKVLTHAYPPPVPNGYEGSITDAQAQYELGVMYFKGSDNVKKDPFVAYRWFQMAANQGHAQAQNNVAVMLFKGMGIRQNNPEAYIWFLKAAEQGFVDSQFNLGMLLLAQDNGKGLPQHIILAYMWFEIAARNGMLEARNNQILLARQMQDAQIQEAKKQASRWLLKYGSSN